MRTIRFLDDQGDEHLGHDFDGEAAIVIEQGLSTGRRSPVARMFAPVDPRMIFCIGLNYRQHAEETGAAIPDRPVVFAKNPASAIGSGDPIVLPDSCRNPLQVDYECELAVIIGRPAKNVSPEEALEYVLGYTAGNDVSARTWQKQWGGGQWVRGKSFDTFCPLGPELVTTDELPDPQALRIITRLNGQVMQDGHTSDMIFSVAELISRLSEDTTLLPGTVIMTGTPSGVGAARKPPVFLKPEDTVEIEVEGIGRLVNPVK